MNRIAQALYDVEESALRNDDAMGQSEYMALIGAANDVEDLARENDTLRGLVRDMLTEMVDYEIIGCCRYVKRARELGIEAEQ